MIKRTLLFSNRAFLSLKDNQLLVDKPKIEGVQEAQKITVPIEDLGVVLLDSHQITLTHPLLNALVENNTALVICNQKHMPSGLFLPLETNTLQQERQSKQLNARLPLKKQLWQQTVQSKIANQAALLGLRGADTEPMEYFQRSVRSGDPDNYEGRAAAFYWKNLFGELVDGNFTRGRYDNPPNNLLNYGYAVLRAVIARNLVGTGLNPTLGIHHHNRYNAFCLADDIMEPYRPFVDRVVLDALHLFDDTTELTTEIKRHLLSIPVYDVLIDGKKSPLMIAAQRTTTSLFECFEGTSRKIVYPVLN